MFEQTQEREIGFALIILTTLRKGKLGQLNFKKHFLIPQFQWNILLWHDQTQKHGFECFYTISIHKNYFKKQKYDIEFV